MAKCTMCAELTLERDRILKGYKGDKKSFRKERKWLYITIAVLLVVIIVMSVGVDNAVKIIEAVKGLFKEIL